MMNKPLIPVTLKSNMAYHVINLVLNSLG